MKKKKWKKHLLFDTCLIATALDPKLIGPTFPPVPLVSLFIGVTGPTGVTGATLSPSYRYLVSNVSANSINSGSNVPFTDKIGSADTPFSSPDAITINTTGIYRVAFQVTTAKPGSSNLMQWTVAINDVRIPNGEFHVSSADASTNAQVTGEYILSLTTGDKLTVQNTSGILQIISGANSSETNAYFLVIRLS